LDIGCGMGQTLLALRLGAAVEAWGIDEDVEAIEAGQKIAPGNIHLVLGAGEHLPFSDTSFDFVFSRVALPYMDIPVALAEISRVLRPGGRFWAALHPPRMLFARMRDDLLQARPRDLGFCGFVAFNSALLRVLGRQIRVRGHCETVQTRAGFSRLLRASGLDCLPDNVQPDQFIVEAQKPS
jgi:ubiquinone/menaquinone biosynthesis C-methylase UbiE